MEGLLDFYEELFVKRSHFYAKIDGWFEVACDGSHHHFKHPSKSGKVTVKDPQKDIPIKTLKRIEAQSGIRFQ